MESIADDITSFDVLDVDAVGEAVDQRSQEIALLAEFALDMPTLVDFRAQLLDGL